MMTASTSGNSHGSMGRSAAAAGDVAEAGDEAAIYDYSTIVNISAWGCEFAPTVRAVVREWNRSVQYWMATYVSRRCLIRNRSVR